jgi:toxin ParE1/3/4
VTPVRWTDQAVEDLWAIREFISRDSPQYGRLVAERIYDATARLEDFPRSGRIVPELNRTDLREVILGEYRIVYLLSPGAVVLVTVFRSSRLFPRALGTI